MKNLFKIFLGLFLVIFAISCNKDDGTELVIADQDVVFDVTNVVQQVAGKSAVLLGKDGANDPLVPECSDLVPTTVQLVLDGPNQSAENVYTIPLVTLNGKTETEVMKLAPGDYKLTSFVVYSGTTAIWASPAKDSYYAVLWPQFNFLNVPFTVAEFNKKRVEVDVLCYKPSSYQEFGFAWFAYAKIEVHTICFFGDICTKYFEEFHTQTQLQNNPYFGQTYNGYDFPAIFDIVVRDAAGKPVNDLTKNNNLTWKGTGAPLCIEYPDIVGVTGETFTFEIFLYMPDGTTHLVYTGNFNDTARSVAGNANGFGGADGIFDFVVGNCSFNGNANVELPAYIHMPKTGNMCISWINSDIYDFYMTFASLVPGPISPDFNLNQAYRALCADEHQSIYVGQCYDFTFYSSLNVPSTSPFASFPWGSLNWLANQPAPVTYEEWKQLQRAVWYVVEINKDPNYQGLGYPANSLATAALTHANFVPSVGDFAFVLADPNNGTGNAIQLLIKAIDP